MTTETTGKISRDHDADSPQTYRLICIHHPGKVTGPRTARRSAPAGVPKEEQKTGVGPGPTVLKQPGTNASEIPAGLENPGTLCSKDSENQSRESPAKENRNGESL